MQDLYVNIKLSEDQYAQLIDSVLESYENRLRIAPTINVIDRDYKLDNKTLLESKKNLITTLVDNLYPNDPIKALQKSNKLLSKSEKHVDNQVKYYKVMLILFWLSLTVNLFFVFKEIWS